MVTAGFPVRRARKPLLKKSQMNVILATSNSDSERQLFYCLITIHVVIKATVIQTSSGSADSYFLSCFHLSPVLTYFGLLFFLSTPVAAEQRASIQVSGWRSGHCD